MNVSKLETIEQIGEFLDGAAEVELASIKAEVDAVPKQALHGSVKSRPTGRRSLPAHLRRIELLHEPVSCTCDHCGKDLIKFGEDVSERRDVDRARFFVHLHFRPQYACHTCDIIIAAPIPVVIV